MSNSYISRSLFTLTIVLLTSTSVFSQRTITVTGEGKAKGKTDYAIISFAIASQDIAAQEVFPKNDEADKKLRKTLTDAGVSGENIKQRTYILKPQYDQSNTQQGPPKFLGYAYFGLYEAKVAPLHMLPKIMDALTSFGAGNVMLESFNSSQIEEINDRALKNAIADAKGRAIKMAQEIGVSVGEIISLTQVALPIATEAPKEEGRNPMERMSTNEVKATATVAVTFSIQ
jgi:uncharacterized protein YggE